MKQLIFMGIVTLAGTVGVVFRPFWGVSVYYLFATLRPQYLWEWSLPPDVQWSRYVSLATISAAIAASIGIIPAVPPGIEQIRPKFGRSQVLIALLACWIFVTYFTARDQNQAFFTFNEYIKIFTMMAVSMVLVRTIDQLYWLAVQSALALGYIAFEINDLYLRAGYLGVYKNGYGGLDNNGAALMLAMGVPCCVLLWDHVRGRWRWFFLALAPVIIHAVLMTYSRGAMLSLLVTSPLLAFRCQRRLQLAALGAVLFCGAIPIMAGPEIQARFLTLKDNEADDSANSRRGSWRAAWNMAMDNPIFGVGIRNANLFSFQYGADMEGRTIHSQYLQIAADNGFVGLGLYLAMLGSVWADTRFCRRAVKGRSDRRIAEDLSGGGGCGNVVGGLLFWRGFSVARIIRTTVFVVVDWITTRSPRERPARRREGWAAIDKDRRCMVLDWCKSPDEGLLMPAVFLPGRDSARSDLHVGVSQDPAKVVGSRGHQSENMGDLSRRIRIGFVMHVMQVAGAEMLVAEIVRRMGELLEPTIICLDGIGALGEQLRQVGVEVVHLERRPGRDYRVAWRMSRLIHRRGIELVHSHQYTPFFYAALAKMISRRRFRLILTEHGRGYPDTVSLERRLVNRWLLAPMADAVTGVCQFSADSLARNDGFSRAKISVIDNGIVLDRYRPAHDRGENRASVGLDPARRYIGNIARFHAVKDQAMLLHAFARVAAAREDVDLLLVGDGTLRNTLSDLCRSLGLEGRVRFLGVRADVPEILRALDVFALTSVSEAASLTLLEAMASRVPVVVTAVGGNPELVRHGVDGLHVPRGDAGATADSILQILDDPYLASRMGRAARQRVEERYQLDATVAAYLRLYRNLCLSQPG